MPEKIGNITDAKINIACPPFLSEVAKPGFDYTYYRLRSHAENKVYNNKHFGSASCLGSATFFGPMFIMDPMQFTQEYNLNWIKNPPAVYRHKDCRWATPFDIIANQNEAILEKSHHTCGMGIWKTIQRYEIAPLQLALGKNTYNKSFDEFMTLPYDEKVKYLNNYKLINN